MVRFIGYREQTADVRQLSSAGKQKALISFADKRLWRSLRRLDKQAKSMAFFDKQFLFDESDLESFGPVLDSIRHLLSPEVRGFGYWIWKPLVILKAMEQMGEGDLAIYVDAGCHLNAAGVARLSDYFAAVESSPEGIVGFQNNPPSDFLVWDGRPLPLYPDCQWAKGDLLDFFEVRENPAITQTPIFGAGVILLRKCEAAVEFLWTWFSIMSEHINLVDDSPSETPNHPWFIENRHDQSVFSIMAKLAGIQHFSSFEYSYPPKAQSLRRRDWKSLAETPVHARGDKDLGLVHKLKRKTMGTLKRYSQIIRN